LRTGPQRATAGFVLSGPRSLVRVPPFGRREQTPDLPNLLVVEFINKVVLITGGSRGIGKAIAGVFAMQGAAVAIAYAAGAQDADTVAAAIRRAGRRAVAIQADVSRANDVAALLEQVLQPWGRLDVLVNNAGTNVRTPPDQLTLREWDEVVGVNLTGAFLCSQAATPALRAAGGSIVNITSVRALIGGSSLPYAASKGGLMAFTKTPWPRPSRPRSASTRSRPATRIRRCSPT